MSAVIAVSVENARDRTIDGPDRVDPEDRKGDPVIPGDEAGMVGVGLGRCIGHVVSLLKGA